jgi:hypothetical protein
MGMILGISYSGSKEYEKKIEDLLTSISSYWPGYALIQAIGAVENKQMKIIPYDPGEVGVCEAATATKDVRRAAPPGFHYYDEDGDLSSWIGTGEGTDAEVSFSPWAWVPGACATYPGSLPDEILVHEMVHGLRMMEGRRNKKPTSSNPEYNDEEEFLAIHFTNTYLSAKAGPRRVRLRGAHNTKYIPSQELPDQYSTTAGFLRNPDFLRILARHITEPLFRRMVGGKAEFNPIGELVANFGRYPIP